MVNVAVVGCGYWGKNLVRNFSELNALHTLYDVDEKKVQELKANYPQVKLSHSLPEIFQDPSIDGVIVATPAESHYRMVKEVLQAGKDVFVEKPIAFTSGEAREMVALAEERGLVLQVGHIYRYHPASLKIKELIEAGKLGKIQYAYGHFMGFKRPRTDVGVTQTDAIHYFDLFNYLLDELPHAVRAVVRHFLNLTLDDTSISVLEYGEKLAFVEAGYMPPETRRDLSIIGDLGSLYCNFQKNSLSFFENRHEKQGERWVALEGDAQQISLVENEGRKTGRLDGIQQHQQALSESGCRSENTSAGEDRVEVWHQAGARWTGFGKIAQCLTDGQIKDLPGKRLLDGKFFRRGRDGRRIHRLGVHVVAHNIGGNIDGQPLHGFFNSGMAQKPAERFAQSEMREDVQAQPPPHRPRNGGR